MSMTPQDPPSPVPATQNEPVRAPAPHQDRPGRVIRALLFGDIRGFSKLTDEQLA